MKVFSLLYIASYNQNFFGINTIFFSAGNSVEILTQLICLIPELYMQNIFVPMRNINFGVGNFFVSP